MSSAAYKSTDVSQVISNNVNDASFQQQQPPLTVREKIINIFENLEITKDELRNCQNQLDKESTARIEAETEGSHLRRQMQLIEVNLDNTTSRVAQVDAQWLDVVKVAEAARYACNNLENKLTMVKDKEIELEDDLRRAKESSIETDKRFQEASKKMVNLQERLEHAEHRSTLADQRIVSLEREIRQAQIEMKSLILAEEKSQRREEEYRRIVNEKMSRLKEAQQRTDESEFEVAKLQQTVDKLKEKLVDERTKYRQLHKMMLSSSG
ncbi:unnamed protein product [Didymodactylos carnosus]|uniref:Uncharacterized protein n=1 Tax=Didymodactylos carnosus TaxID=1234261 RepID=A0A8S2EV83_9BILA|nr:unnamed protein product [Didymodactylos carnosus]CAF4069938.1 unnamed protein product [Didymodactylos carnosus]